jgi:hypothetical protein
VLRTVTDEAVLRGGGGGEGAAGGEKRVGCAGRCAPDLDAAGPRPGTHSTGRLGAALVRPCPQNTTADPLRRRCPGASPPQSSSAPRRGSLEHVRAAGQRLLAGLAAPDAHSHALHRKLRGGARVWGGRRAAAREGGEGGSSWLEGARRLGPAGRTARRHASRRAAPAAGPPRSLVASGATAAAAAGAGTPLSGARRQRSPPDLGKHTLPLTQNTQAQTTRAHTRTHRHTHAHAHAHALARTHARSRRARARARAQPPRSRPRRARPRPHRNIAPPTLPQKLQKYLECWLTSIFLICLRSDAP